ncbi:hypothetical protein QQ045_020919 [Rhodiola kirilowii]
MSLRSKAWIVASTVGAVEAMKDQGFARWNYTIRSLNQHAKNNLRSYAQAKNISSSSPAPNRATQEKSAQEESMRKVMYLSCWVSFGRSTQAALACATVYGAEQDDTCISVGQKFKLDENAFLSINPNINCNKIFVGQWLCVDKA